MARMIYHVPYALTADAKTGSGVRPMRMLQAFRDNGYEVELIAGVSRERSAMIKSLRARIRAGETFDFVYSESHTMPTALTDPDHLPRHPFMDVSFLRFCRTHGIKVGLFYRDVYWRFPEYRKRLNTVVHIATRALYNFDLIAYKYAVDTLYLPSLGMGNFIPHVPATRHTALPPGGQIEDVESESADGRIQLFYVGGLGGYYNMRDCVRAVGASKNAFLTICTREDEWRQVESSYQELMSDRINIVHKHGADLAPYYAKADICMLFIEPSIYRSFAAPIKFAEYVGFGKPVIVNEGTNVADFVVANGNGWAVPFNEQVLTSLLDELADQPQRVSAVTATALSIRTDNTWQARARQVALELAPHS